MYILSQKEKLCDVYSVHRNIPSTISSRNSTATSSRRVADCPWAPCRNTWYHYKKTVKALLYPYLPPWDLLIMHAYHFCQLPILSLSWLAFQVYTSTVKRNNLWMRTEWGEKRRDNNLEGIKLRVEESGGTCRWLLRWYRVSPFMPITLSTDFGVASANCKIVGGMNQKHQLKERGWRICEKISESNTVSIHHSKHLIFFLMTINSND